MYTYFECEAVCVQFGVVCCIVSSIIDLYTFYIYSCVEFTHIYCSTSTFIYTVCVLNLNILYLYIFMAVQVHSLWSVCV